MKTQFKHKENGRIMAKQIFKEIKNSKDQIISYITCETVGNYGLKEYTMINIDYWEEI